MALQRALYLPSILEILENYAEGPYLPLRVTMSVPLLVSGVVCSGGSSLCRQNYKGRHQINLRWDPSYWNVS